MIILWSPQNVISNLACYKWLPNERSISKIAAAELKNDDDRHSHDWMANTVTHLWNRTLAVVDRWQLWISNGFWMGKWSCTLRLTVKWVVFLLFVVCAKSFIIFVTLMILEKKVRNFWKQLASKSLFISLLPIKKSRRFLYLGNVHLICVQMKMRSSKWNCENIPTLINYGLLCA